MNRRQAIQLIAAVVPAAAAVPVALSFVEQAGCSYRASRVPSEEIHV